MKPLLNNQITKKQASYPRQQAGLSLIELMISVVIGLFLLGGVISNFIGTKDSDRMRSAISEMDANARAAFSIMRQNILHAGYPSMYNIRLEKAFFTPSDLAGGALSNPTCGDGSTLRDNNNSTPGSDQRTRDRSRADVITVVALADNPCTAGKANCATANVNPKALFYTDCMGGGATRNIRTVSCSADPMSGMPNPEDAKIYSTFRVGGRVGPNGEDNSRTLYCDGSRGGSQPIVDNIEAMQILYGVKMDDDRIIYKRANSVESDGQWGLVRSVQIALLVRSSDQYLLKAESTKTQYTLLDEDWDIASADSRRLFRVYTTTINLENLNRGALL